MSPGDSQGRGGGRGAGDRGKQFTFEGGQVQWWAFGTKLPNAKEADRERRETHRPRERPRHGAKSRRPGRGRS